jgi:hypothetical protein
MVSLCSFLSNNGLRSIKQAILASRTYNSGASEEQLHLRFTSELVGQAMFLLGEVRRGRLMVIGAQWMWLEKLGAWIARGNMQRSGGWTFNSVEMTIDEGFGRHTVLLMECWQRYRAFGKGCEEPVEWIAALQLMVVG